MKILLLFLVVLIIVPSIAYPTRKIDLGEKGKKIVNERSEAIKKAEEAARLAKQKQIEAQKAQQEKEDWIRSVTEQRNRGVPVPYVVVNNVAFYFEAEDKGIQPSEYTVTTWGPGYVIGQRIATTRTVKDPGRPGHPPRVKIAYGFINQTPGIIIGLSYRIEFLDNQNKVIHSESREKNIRIEAWSSTSVESNNESFQDNVSKDDDTYDKINQVAMYRRLYGTQNAQVIINKIVWANGKVTGNLPGTANENEKADQEKTIADQKKRQAKIKSVNDQRAKGIIIPYVTATCNMELYDLSNPEYKKSPDGIYPHSIKFNIDLSNNTDAEIKGIILNLQIIGQNGNLLLKKEYILQDIIEPWGSLYIWPIFHDYRDNTADDCDKVLDALKNGTGKTKVVIDKISWSNGAITGNLPKKID